MTGPTHRQYGICFAYIACIFLYIKGLTEINYYIALIILLQSSKAGALFPDIDHDWANVRDKTGLNKILNFIIHLTGGKHRSWQTHSWDICTYFTILSYYLPNMLFQLKKISLINKELLYILMIGFSAGWISHLFSDMLTSAGVRLICFVNFKIKLVPRKLGPLVFNTGNSWEAFNYKTVKAINSLLGIGCVIYPLLPLLKQLKFPDFIF